MIGAAILMKNNKVTILENVNEAEIENFRKENNMNLILCEDAIDWDYGY